MQKTITSRTSTLRPTTLITTMQTTRRTVSSFSSCFAVNLICSLNLIFVLSLFFILLQDLEKHNAAMGITITSRTLLRGGGYVDNEIASPSPSLSPSPLSRSPSSASSFLQRSQHVMTKTMAMQQKSQMSNTRTGLHSHTHGPPEQWNPALLNPKNWKFQHFTVPHSGPIPGVTAGESTSSIPIRNPTSSSHSSVFQHQPSAAEMAALQPPHTPLQEKFPYFIPPMAPSGMGGPGTFNPFSNINYVNPMALWMTYAVGNRVH